VEFLTERETWANEKGSPQSLKGDKDEPQVDQSVRYLIRFSKVLFVLVQARRVISLFPDEPENVIVE
jgi:hypothetical protein